MPHWSYFLSPLRILAALLICGLAWLRYETWYLIGLVFLLIAFSGSRWLLHIRQPEGHKSSLEAVADIATFLAIPVGGWLLFPHLIIQERIFVATVFVSYFAMSVYGHLQHNGYHQISSIKVSILSVLLAAAVLTGYLTNNTWMFRVCALLSLLAVPHFFSREKS